MHAQQGLGGSWQEVAPEDLKTQLGMAVRQLKGNWRIGILLRSLHTQVSLKKGPHLDPQHM